MRHLLLAAAAAAGLLLGACERSAAPDLAGLKDEAAPAVALSCDEAYANAQTKSTRLGPEIEENLDYGQPGILFLSFDSLTEKDAAATAVESLPGYSYRAGETLRVFKNLPLLAVAANPISTDLVTTLAKSLENHELRGLYQDRPLQYFLAESSPFIGADRARTELGATGHGIGVAINDSGVDVGQGDFSAIARNVKFLPPSPHVRPPVFGYVWVEVENGDTTSGHGTHVAGTIGGDGAMSGGHFTGMAPGATLLGVGAGDTLYIYYAVEGFDYILDDAQRIPLNIRVTNNSWGGVGGGFRPYSPVSVATKRAHDLGVISVFAAGNSGSTQGVMNPHSASPCVISVAAGTKRGALASFSSFGTAGDPYDHPDITAPGVDIYSARARQHGVAYAAGGGTVDPDYPHYVAIGGTSMAAPHVAGVLAQMLEVNPDLTNEQALEVLQATATPMLLGGKLPLENWKVGAGYINAYAAVQQAIATSTRRAVKTVETWAGEVPASACASAVLTSACAVQGFHEHEITLPDNGPGARLDSLSVKIEWIAPGPSVNLELVGPDGKTLGVTGSGNGINRASLFATRLVPGGKYKVITRGYQNGPLPYTGTATLHHRVPR